MMLCFWFFLERGAGSTCSFLPHGVRSEGNNLKPHFAKWGNPDLHLHFSNPGASLFPNPIRGSQALQGSPPLAETQTALAELVGPRRACMCLLHPAH